MIAGAFNKLLTQDAPGEFRAALCDAADRPVALFAQRWAGQGDRVRYGDVLPARLRLFADDSAGAFVEFASGEEAYLRLKARTGLTEGAILNVEVRSEARHGKLARVSLTEQVAKNGSVFEHWQTAFPGAKLLTPEEDANSVEAAFTDTGFKSVVLPGGGQLHIDRTRALTVFDIDTSGRIMSGSAGARALKLNREAALEMVRQVSLRGLGGLLVLDCLDPLNNASREHIRDATREAFSGCGLAGARVLKPSPLNLLEVAIPWRFMPIEDVLSADPGETALLKLLRDLQRDAKANPSRLYTLSLGGSAWQAYQARKVEAAQAIEQHFGSRVTVVRNPNNVSEFVRR
ncbi:MAG: ribonuclease E/G [Hyphomonadaceae bacterium]|nr:ribonuclease E/G [Hyphomonadaceae bacterium]